MNKIELKKVIPIDTNDYNNLTKQYLGQGIINNHSKETSLW